MVGEVPTTNDFLRIQTASLPFVHALKRAARHAEQRKSPDSLFVSELLAYLKTIVYDAPSLRPLHALIGHLKIETTDHT